MPNQIADFMRERADLDEKALTLGIMPTTYSYKQVGEFFRKAADEIDRLEADLGAKQS